MTFDREKFKNLVHYVIHQAGDRDGFGATKLYKVLWFSEARCFVLDGKPIAGATYIREKHGPIPRLGMAVREELASEKCIQQWKAPVYNHEGWRLKSIKSPYPLKLSNREKQCVDFWISHIDKDHTATSKSEESHDYAWEIADMGETLPMHAILSERTRRPIKESLDWAKERAKELGLI